MKNQYKIIIQNNLMMKNQSKTNITNNLNNTDQNLRKTIVQKNGPIDLGDDIIF